MNDLKDKIMIELAYANHMALPVSETATRIVAIIKRRHIFWGSGEPDCPQEIKASNGEIWKLRCKSCGLDNPRSSICLGDTNERPD